MFTTLDDVEDIHPIYQIHTTWIHLHGALFPTYNGRAAKLRLLNFLSLFRDLQKPTRFSGGGG